MGVICLINFPIAEGKSGQQTVDLIQKRLEQMGAEKTGTFFVDCETYQCQIPGTSQRSVHLLHNSEQPASCFGFIDSQTGTNIVVDLAFDGLMHKMKQFYSKKQARVESRGQRYQLGDFIVKVGSVIVGQMTSFKGLLIEVEYEPCVVASECWQLMIEFMRGFLGNINFDTPSQHFRTHLESIQGPTDSIQQYLEHFLLFRRSVSQTQGQTPR